MTSSRARRASLAAQIQVERAFAALERFLHIEAASGIVLVLAAVVALVWANSPAAESYHHLWHTEVTLGFGALSVSRSLHFLINDALMTVFFLVVGMEIRREIHQGALASLRQAALPLGAALGGVVVPALVFVALNAEPAQRQGWAVPTATDIAFAVGVLALLGRSIPGNVRILLLAIAIIDDIVAVLVIAVFYSGGLEYAGLAVAGLGLGMVLLLQWLGIASPYAYVAPGAVVWLGLLQTGAHPTLAGVALGLLTPVLARRGGGEPLDHATAALAEICDAARDPARGADHIAGPLRRLRVAQRDLMPPVTRVQMALHPWVAYGVMPLFALANAGVTVSGFDAQAVGSAPVMLGVGVALALGKPVGIVGIAWLMVRLRWCSLPPGVTWGGVTLVGLLAGIGFTMSIFIATLGYADPNLLAAAKLGVLGGSLAAAVAGLGWGVWLIRGRPRQVPTRT